MPTNVTHAIPAIAIGLGLGKKVIPFRVMLTGALIASIPDLDMIGTRSFGVPWDSIYGHRGYTHSILFALLIAFCFAKLFSQTSFKKIFIFFSVCMLSHGLLDSCNSGGLGIAFLWPLSNHRYHNLLQPIMNVNVSFRGLYLSSKGLPVFISEIIWVWLPFLGIFLFLKFNGNSLLKNRLLKNSEN